VDVKNIPGKFFFFYEAIFPAHIASDMPETAVSTQRKWV
jgi:hypothetical protein